MGLIARTYNNVRAPWAYTTDGQAKARELGVLPAMPRWFDLGLWEFLRSTRFDGKKIEFVSGEVERGRIKYYAQNKQSMPALWDLMQEHIRPKA